jgi:hypothetical protein
MSSVKTLTLAGLLVGFLGSALGCGGETDDRPARWSVISPAIMQPSCATANCHSELANRAGVNLSDVDVGYSSLVDRHFVVPGDAPRSSVLHLMRANGARRMPPDFPLPAADILLVERWIADGAMKN